MPANNRPKWSVERGERWVAAYERLGSVTFACDAVGISCPTFYDWMRRGAEGLDPELSDFYFAARAARAAHAQELMIAARRDKGGPQFLLERLFPAEFGAPAKAGREAMQQLLELVLPRLSLQARVEVLDALAAIERERSGAGEQRVAGAAEADAGAIDADGELVEHRRLEPSTE